MRPADLDRLAQGDAADIEARCIACHDDVAAEHRSSLHREAWTHPAFQRAFAIERSSFCQGCHAPEAPADQPVPARLGAVGVGCVTCHVRNGVVLAAPLRAGHDLDRMAPHDVTRDERFGGPLACAKCHEFAFPRAPGRDPNALMQLTLEEHARSPYAAFGCADCHMRRVDGQHRDHAFAASRDPDMLRRAVNVSASRLGPTSIRIVLSPGEVGHAFPTGDLFRRLTVSAEVVGHDFALIGYAERHLARHFLEVRSSLMALRVQKSDDRVGPASNDRVVDLELGAKDASVNLPIRWRVRYERVDHPLSIDGEEALVEGFVTIAEGRLP